MGFPQTAIAGLRCHAMTPEAQLIDTAATTMSRFGMCVTEPEIDPWVVVGGVLMAQQAAVIALRAAAGSAAPVTSASANQPAVTACESGYSRSMIDSTAGS